MEIISRADAHEKKLKHFFTGKPCKRGHLRERSVQTGACLGCLSHYAQQYASKYRQKSNAQASGMVDHTVSIHAEHAPLVDQFVALLGVVKARGTPAPMVPPIEHVTTVNTMISMLQPTQATPSAPPVAPAAAQAEPDVDARYAMWKRIHGEEIADQMLENARRA